jgi:hypothetical protein
MFGVAIYDGVDPSGAQVRESHVSAPADAPKPPTKWLNGFCQETKMTPAEVYENQVRAGWHVKLVDKGDMVRVDATESEASNLYLTFYRTMAACKVAETARKTAVEHYEQWLDKYR